MPTDCRNIRGEPVDCPPNTPGYDPFVGGTITYNAGGIPGNVVYNPPGTPPEQRGVAMPVPGETPTVEIGKDNTFLYLIAVLILIILFGSNS